MWEYDGGVEHKENMIYVGCRNDLLGIFAENLLRKLGKFILMKANIFSIGVFL